MKKRDQHLPSDSQKHSCSPPIDNWAQNRINFLELNKYELTSENRQLKQQIENWKQSHTGTASELQNHIFQLIRDERIRQDGRWGKQNNSHEKWLTIIFEEIGECARATLKKDEKNLKEELVQVASVIVAWLETYQINNKI